MDVGREKIRRGWLLALIGLVLVVLAPVIMRSALDRSSVLVEIVLPSGEASLYSLEEVKAHVGIEREGVYQNQYGNWRDQGLYRGALLSELIGTNAVYDEVLITASDGYTARIERHRVEDQDYPMVLAISLDGTEVPAWSDGPRIAVLPDDGDVSNEEYDAVSAGSFWVKNVRRIELLTAPSSSSTD